MSKWSRLTTTIKLAFGMEDIGNTIEPAVNIFSPVANLTSQAVDAAGDYLPESYVNEAQAAHSNLKDDRSAKIVDNAINSLYESDFYKDYKPVSEDPASMKKLKDIGLELSTRSNATPLRKALNSIRAKSHINDVDALWSHALKGTGIQNTPENLKLVKTYLDAIGSTGDQPLPARARLHVIYNDHRSIEPYSFIEHLPAQWKPGQVSTKELNNRLVDALSRRQADKLLPVTETLSDFEGINNPEFASLNRISEDHMSPLEYRDRANRLKTRFGEEYALDVLNSEIKGSDRPSLLKLRNGK